LEATTLIKSHTVRYWSVSDNFTITRVKPDEVIQPSGKMVVRNKSEYDRFRVEFHHNQYEAKVGDKILENPETGEPEDEVTFLERQPSFGVHFHRLDDQAPPSDDVQREVMRLALSQDLDGLVLLAETEQANWARPEVGKAIIEALASLHQGTEDEARQGEIRAAYERVLEAGVPAPEPPDPED
jgi:hypothetical protein